MSGPEHWINWHHFVYWYGYSQWDPGEANKKGNLIPALLDPQGAEGEVKDYCECRG